MTLGKRRAALAALATAVALSSTLTVLTAPVSAAPSATAAAYHRLHGETGADSPYPQSLRTESYDRLTRSQAEENAQYAADPARFGKFTDYFASPDFGVHVAMLPTGKVLLFSFEMFQEDPFQETAPTNVTGRRNAGRAYVWDPARGSGKDAFTAVPLPVIDMPDDTNEPRPAPVFCAGHAYLPNGMVAVFGGNLGGRNGSGAKLAFVFDPWTETWHRQQDMQVGRWYPSVVTGADGRQLIMSGQSHLGYNTPTPIIERFPALAAPVPRDRSQVPDGVALDRLDTEAPYTKDFPQLFALRDGKVYGFGREAGQQWVFDPADDSRRALPNRPDGGLRNYGSAVPLPNGTQGPDSVLVLGGNRNDPKTYRFSGGQWSEDTPRAFGRTQDDTLVLPDATLLSVNGGYDIRDYGGGDHNPNVPDQWLKFRHTEIRGTDGTWTLGPAQRLPRGYHSNAVLLPDGRIMVTGDEDQQTANNPDIKSGMNGSIEIYEPPYLHRGDRPVISGAPTAPVGYGSTFRIDTTTPDRAERAVLVAPVTSTHSVDTSQRRLELRTVSAGGGQLLLQAPASAQDAPPGYYMLFLLDARGVPSVAKWVQLKSAS
ncbi:galactose oxidase-like domain-containing protein [Kitasatospora sp. NPDC057198]|uniref:galactose oxidase-like domain-containing protein n=1 Tax=Kitasatospora sp. NPDC057198 TaxID=3346046 RepID=UPI00363E3CA6